jgi:nicotinic acetylcholine receptor, invertebrate
LDGPASHRYYFDPRRNKTRDQMVFTIKMKRKSLFYTFNLIIPTFLISSLTVCVFHLPAGDKNKIILSLSLLFALVVFFLLIGKIIPPTSVVVPLISKYFLLTFILNISSILCTVIVINVYQKETDRFHPWLHYIFVVILPFLLFMEYKTHDFVLIDFNNKKSMYLKPPSIEIKTDIAKINNTSRKFNLYKDYNYNEIKIGDENK